MKKRGIVLLVLAVFVLILSVLISASPQDTGCCTNPDLLIICQDSATETSCCGGAEDYDSCVESYFFNATPCSNVPNNLCNSTLPVCCTDPDDPRFCDETVVYRAQCYNRSSFVNQLCSEVPACKEGCCICIDEDELTYTYDVNDPIKTFAECKTHCESFTIPYQVGYHDTSITNVQTCVETYIGQFEKANISGFVKNQVQQLVSNASITIDDKNTTTSLSGFYQLANLTPGKSKTIIINHTDYKTLIQNIDLKAGENNYNFTLRVEGAGKINGTVYNELGETIKNAIVRADTLFDYTDDNGSYEITGLSLGEEYEITAFLSGYQSNTTTLNLTANLTLDFTLKSVPVADLAGRIINKQGGAPVAGAEIRLDDKQGQFQPIATTSYPQGEFLFEDIPVRDTPTTYTITVTKQGFKTAVDEIILEKGDEITDKEIKLDPFKPACGFTEKVPPRDSFKANPIQGKKAVLLTWTNPCTTTAGYILTKQGAFGETWIFDVTESEQQFEFIDEDVEWNTTYSYSIIAVYDIGLSDPVQSTITLGNYKCEGKIGEFCLNNTQRARCNESNQIVFEGLTGRYADCTEKGLNYFCTGPDSNGITYCKDESECSPLVQESIFGLYTNPFKLDSMPSCYGGYYPPDNQYPNYCYFDFSDTIVDKCYSCSEASSCFDYRSETACLLDKNSCLTAEDSECKWFNINPELGKGICYRQDYDGIDRCYLCSEDKIFFNQGCTQEICSKLGHCYSNEDQSSCLDCGEDAVCEQYKSEHACGLQPIFIDEYGKITSSDDACGLGVCRWNGTSCFKDGNDDNVPDCSGLSGAALVSCQEDTTPPSTTLAEVNPKVTKQDTTITFDVNETGSDLYYCIVSEPDALCTDADFVTAAFPPSRKYSADLSNYKNGQWKKTSINVYYAKFYSIDSHDNREELKTKRFFADLTVPEISLYYETIPKTGSKGDLIIDISSTEIITCTDNLTSSTAGTIPGKLDSANIEFTKQLNYSNLNYGLYFYTLNCSDFGGNTIEKSVWINVEDPFIIINSPDKAVKSTTIVFDVSTAEPAACSLYDLDTLKEEITTSYVKRHQSKPYSGFIENRHYPSYKITCTYSGGTRTAYIPFTIDRLPPSTQAVLISQNEEINPAGTQWTAKFDKPVSLKFECTDYPEFGYGCGPTLYCLNESFCEPDKTYSGKITISNSTKVCYKSIDNGDWQETVKCGEIGIKKPLGIKIISPSYGVSNTPNFDVEIQTEKPTDSCKYSGNQFFDYNTLTNEKLIFDKLGFYDYKKENFPALLWEKNFTPVSPPYTWSKGPYTQYNMYVKCIDSETLEINDEHPAFFAIYYDATAPEIKSAYTSNYLGGPETKTITTKFAWITVNTDDETLCRFSKTKENYASMENKFPGYELEEFKKSHSTYIEDPEQGTTHKYYIQCMNKAENLSDTVEISFAVDKSQTGAITSASASYSYKDGTTTFLVETNKYAACTYTVEGKTSDITSYPSLSHRKETSEFTDEGEYKTTIRCTFPDTLKTDTEKITFAVDKTNPVMKDIIIGEHVCNANKIMPTFVAEDNLSDIVQYNYTVSEAGLLGDEIKTGTTTDSTPKIKGLDLEFNKTYVIEASAKDAAGLWSTSIKSNEFDLLEEDSVFCQEQGPPTVRIEETINSDGTKDISLICEDESGCSLVLYGISGTREDCSPIDTYSSPILITQTTYVCWEAFDTIGNNATGDARIIIGEIGDSDGDSIPDSDDICPDTPYYEIIEVITDSGSPNYGCSPSEIDSDSDGMPDFWEIQYNLNPNDPSDRDEDLDNDGLTNYQEYLQHTDPTIAELADLDNDGVSDDIDECPGTPFGEIVDSSGCSASQKDTDNDGMDDAWELKYGLDPNNPSDKDGDIDEDELTNIEEYTFKTNPIKKDSDGDGFDDAEEIDKAMTLLIRLTILKSQRPFLLYC